mmetsp:Transcript_124559/g.229611  ORF Transcript_124559/g.229611 Transcript_124559/m.229611 type:complete len:273 (+) Transcript_124559:446-1264(+)
MHRQLLQHEAANATGVQATPQRVHVHIYVVASAVLPEKALRHSMRACRIEVTAPCSHFGSVKTPQVSQELYASLQPSLLNVPLSCQMSIPRDHGQLLEHTCHPRSESEPVTQRKILHASVVDRLPYFVFLQFFAHLNSEDLLLTHFWIGLQVNQGILADLSQLRDVATTKDFLKLVVSCIQTMVSANVHEDGLRHSALGIGVQDIVKANVISKVLCHPAAEHIKRHEVIRHDLLQRHHTLHLGVSQASEELLCITRKPQLDAGIFEISERNF